MMIRRRDSTAGFARSSCNHFVRSFIIHTFSVNTKRTEQKKYLSTFKFKLHDNFFFKFPNQILQLLITQKGQILQLSFFQRLKMSVFLMLKLIVTSWKLILQWPGSM